MAGGRGERFSVKGVAEPQIPATGDRDGRGAGFPEGEGAMSVEGTQEEEAGDSPKGGVWMRQGVQELV